MTDLNCGSGGHDTATFIFTCLHTNQTNPMKAILNGALFVPARPHGLAGTANIN